MTNSQIPVIRRAYIVRPSLQLLERLKLLGEADLAESFSSSPTVVMTEALPYEEMLEGRRSLILGKCKAGFVADLRDVFEDRYITLFGDQPAIASFDTWWLAEEADTIEISTDW